MEYGKAVEKIHSELNAANADNVHMHQQLADKMRRCEELSSQLTGIYQEAGYFSCFCSKCVCVTVCGCEFMLCWYLNFKLICECLCVDECEFLLF